jgi:hypothetical protein
MCQPSVVGFAGHVRMTEARSDQRRAPDPAHARAADAAIAGSPWLVVLCSILAPVALFIDPFFVSCRPNGIRV